MTKVQFTWSSGLTTISLVIPPHRVTRRLTEERTTLAGGSEEEARRLE